MMLPPARQPAPRHWAGPTRRDPTGAGETIHSRKEGRPRTATPPVPGIRYGHLTNGARLLRIYLHCVSTREDAIHIPKLCFVPGMFSASGGMKAVLHCVESVSPLLPGMTSTSGHLQRYSGILAQARAVMYPMNKGTEVSKGEISSGSCRSSSAPCRLRLWPPGRRPAPIP